MTSGSPRTRETSEEASRPAAVYRLYAADGALLYIGSSYNPDARCEAHRRNPWWSEVARRTDQWFDHRGTAYREELKAIGDEKSRYNRMGTPSYRTPATEAVRQRKELGPLRQRLLQESSRVAQAAERAAYAEGAIRDDAVRAGKLAEIEFLEATGLFAGAVKRRRERLWRSSGR